MRDRSFARGVAQEHFDRSRPADWFDILYREADGNEKLLPWVDDNPNPNLVSWLDREQFSVAGKRVLVVGCGLGQDAEELARRGGKVVAFDISPTAIEWARKRHPSSTVDYRCADLFSPPADFHRAFDFVLEAYTAQALPPEVRERAAHAVASFVGSRGQLLVVCRARDEAEDPGTMPWPLTERELHYFERGDLSLIALEDYVESEQGEMTRRFRALFGPNGG